MKEFWRKIVAGAQVVGDFQARLILSLLYYVLVLPIGLLTRLGGDGLQARSLGKPAAKGSFWQARPDDAPTLRRARRQH